MITRYKNFTIFKAKPSENEKLPTHAISMKIGEEYVNVGGCWTKDSTNGKYLSGKLADAWVSTNDDKKARKGYAMVCEDDLNQLERQLERLAGKPVEQTKSEPVIDIVDGREINLDDLPF